MKRNQPGKWMCVFALIAMPMLCCAQKSTQRFFENSNQSMYVTYKNGVPSSISMIFPTPESTDDGMIVLEGVLETTETLHQYLFNDQYSGSSWKVYETETTLTFECSEGDCYDKNGKYELWKEPFHFVSEEK